MSLAVLLHPFRQVAPFIPCSLSLFSAISIAVRGKQETEHLPPRNILDYPSFIARKWLTVTVELRKTGLSVRVYFCILCLISRDLDWMTCLDYAKSYVICLCVSMKTCVENNVQFWSERNSVQWLQPASNIKHLHGDKMDWRSDVKLEAMEAKMAVNGKTFF
jgi:hypothetical protein